MSPILIDPLAAEDGDRRYRTVLLRAARGGAVVHVCGDSHAVSVGTEIPLLSERDAISRPPLAASDEPLSRERRADAAWSPQEDDVESPDSQPDASVARLFSRR